MEEKRTERTQPPFPLTVILSNVFQFVWFIHFIHLHFLNHWNRMPGEVNCKELNGVKKPMVRKKWGERTEWKGERWKLNEGSVPATVVFFPRSVLHQTQAFRSLFSLGSVGSQSSLSLTIPCVRLVLCGWTKPNPTYARGLVSEGEEVNHMKWTNCIIRSIREWDRGWGRNGRCIRVVHLVYFHSFTPLVSVEISCWWWNEMSEEANETTNNKNNRPTSTSPTCSPSPRLHLIPFVSLISYQRRLWANRFPFVPSFLSPRVSSFQYEREKKWMKRTACVSPFGSFNSFSYLTSQ